MLGDLYNLAVRGAGGEVFAVIRPLVIYGAGFAFLICVLAIGVRTFGARARRSRSLQFSNSPGASSASLSSSLGLGGSRASMPSLRIGSSFDSFSPAASSSDISSSSSPSPDQWRQDMMLSLDEARGGDSDWGWEAIDYSKEVHPD